jgi:hypothetical protein
VYHLDHDQEGKAKAKANTRKGSSQKPQERSSTSPHDKVYHKEEEFYDNDEEKS